MADGAGGAIKQTVQDIGEGVVKPVVDEVGKDIEQASTAITSIPNQTTKNQTLTPQEKAQKEAEEKKKKDQTLRTIEWYKQIDQSQKTSENEPAAGGRKKEKRS